jgi:hypothetical protein
MSEDTPPLETEASRRVQASTDMAGTMGSRQTGKSEGLAPWHPVPARLVDTVMPHLRDTELRVLLVVLRQTWGWKIDRTKTGLKMTTALKQRNSGQKISKPATKNKPATKHRDWLSHSQLCQRTGRGSDAVSAAIAALTASGLIIVEDAGGKPLKTPQERRRCLGRLYFRPGTIWRE